MNDYLVRALAKEAGVLGLVCMTTELARETVVDCHFCHERYLFGPEELTEILCEP